MGIIMADLARTRVNGGCNNNNNFYDWYPRLAATIELNPVESKD